MAKKDDIDLQTFQIFQDEETETVPLDDPINPQKKKSGFGGLMQKMREKKPVVENLSVKTPAQKPKNSVKEIVVGLSVGLIFILIVIAIDQLT
ncbi:hypothetical protein GW796_08900 [archaeon]|nr:hypothetical protein [archaeon]NCQ51996.1 hypothetical protein [archaeon]